MYIIVGLGNPGKEYENTRHNIGFDVITKIAEDFNFSNFVSKFQGLYSEGEIAGEKVKLLMPQTFMNLSGKSVAEIIKFYKVSLENLIVIHDELDLALGKIRIKKGGSNGGHNGLKSIDGMLGKEYQRLRFGIGHPGNKLKVNSYVLGKFAKDEVERVDFMVGEISMFAECLIKNEFGVLMSKTAMNFQNYFKPDEPEELEG